MKRRKSAAFLTLKRTEIDANKTDSEMVRFKYPRLEVIPPVCLPHLVCLHVPFRD